jgi:hypothetical protein
MKANRDQCVDMARQVGVIGLGDWLVDGNKLEALVHLAQQFTLDQLIAQGAVAWTDPTHTYVAPATVSTVFGSHTIPLHRIPETLK